MLNSRHIRNNSIISGLKSGDDKIVLSSIEEIRLHGNIDILPALIALIFDNSSKEVQSSAINVLNDLKDPSAVPVIARSLLSFRGKNNFYALVSSCWQNGLDFSPHLNLFVDFLTDDDLEVAIEAYSVIEENIHHLDDPGKTELLELITTRINSINDDCRINLMVKLTCLLKE